MLIRAILILSAISAALCITTIILIFAANGYRYKTAAKVSEYTGLGTTLLSLTTMMCWLVYIDIGKSRLLAEIMKHLVLPIGAYLLAAAFGFVAYSGVLCMRPREEDLGKIIDKEV